MTGSQYKNIIVWSLHLNENLKNETAINVTTRLCTNLGVAFPHGNYDKIIDVLKTEKYLGWRVCSPEDVQKYANIGIATIGINSNTSVLIIPDYNINSLSCFSEKSNCNNKFVKHSSELDIEGTELQFFVYSYGYKVKEKS